MSNKTNSQAEQQAAEQESQPTQPENQASKRATKHAKTTVVHLVRHGEVENPGRVLSKAQILDHVWHYDFGGEAGVVESYVSYLRKKVDTGEPRLIHTLRGVGYVMRLPRD